MDLLRKAAGQQAGSVLPQGTDFPETGISTIPWKAQENKETAEL